MIALYFWYRGIIVINYPFNLLGIIFIVLGLGITIKISRKFSAVDTEIHTFKTPRKLVINGLFKYSRNPIYTGFLIALIGVSILLGNLSSIIGVLLFFFAANFWYIPFEENQLEKEFGKQYSEYKNSVRRWI